jgi:hypothetical protein
MSTNIARELGVHETTFLNMEDWRQVSHIFKLKSFIYFDQDSDLFKKAFFEWKNVNPILRTRVYNERIKNSGQFKYFFEYIDEGSDQFLGANVQIEEITKLESTLIEDRLNFLIESEQNTLIDPYESYLWKIKFILTYINIQGRNLSCY